MLSRLFIRIVMALVCLSYTCCTPVPQEPSVPIQNHNGPLATGNSDDCRDMCVNLRARHCPAGDPTPKGATCEAVCENAETSGYASENPRCQAKATSCDAADACVDSGSAP
jgi:hypothetical protein